MQESNTHYYVQVSEPSGSKYDVGPFAEAGDSFSYGKAAIDWIYRQIGLLKTAHPDAELVKHKWHYRERDNGFSDPAVEIEIELAGFKLEIKALKPPSFQNVIEERIERK